jgi:hypothetical protein
MRVRDEIEKYSAEKDKPVLLWLFERYHGQHEWNVMATPAYRGNYMQGTSRRSWAPSPTGAALYEHAEMKKALEFYADPENWKQIETGIGMMSSPATDDGGHTAREALPK